MPTTQTKKKMPFPAGLPAGTKNRSCLPAGKPAGEHEGTAAYDAYGKVAVVPCRLAGRNEESILAAGGQARRGAKKTSAPATYPLGRKETSSGDPRTLQAMLAIYCRGQHASTSALCEECRALLAYALEKLAKCPFVAQKPTCAKCPIHCYHPTQRAAIRAVMAYAGPRMLLHHPVMALQHTLAGLRQPKKTTP